MAVGGFNIGGEIGRRFDPYRRSHLNPLFSRVSDKPGMNRPARIGTDMHGYAEKSCTKLAPFFPGTVLGLTTKIPQSAEFARHVAAGAAPPPRISTRNPNENGSNASPRRSKRKALWITIPFKRKPSPPRAVLAPSTRPSPVARPSCRSPPFRGCQNSPNAHNSLDGLILHC